MVFLLSHEDYRLESASDTFVSHCQLIFRSHDPFVFLKLGNRMETTQRSFGGDWKVKQIP